jgi:hypothetical protein
MEPNAGKDNGVATLRSTPLGYVNICFHLGTLGNSKGPRKLFRGLAVVRIVFLLLRVVFCWVLWVVFSRACNRRKADDNCEGGS